jgi:hypothetical protein
MAANDLTFTLNSTTNWYETDLTNSTGHPSANPLGNSGPFVVALDYGTATEEKILCSSVVLSTGVVTVWVDGSNSSNTGRGYDGSAAQPHTSGSSGTALPVFTSTEAGLANYAVQQTVGQITGAGDTLYGTAANTLGILTAGTLGQVLTAQGAASPQWQTNRGTSYYSAAASPPSAPTQGQVWYQTDTHALLVYSGSAWLNTYPSGVPAGRMYALGSIASVVGAFQVTSMAQDFVKGSMTYASNGLTVPVAGIYSVQASIGWQATAGGAPPGTPKVGTYIKVGSTYARSGGLDYLTSSGVYPASRCSDLLNLAAGSVLSLGAYCDTTALGTVADTAYTYLSAVLVSQ